VNDTSTPEVHGNCNADAYCSAIATARRVFRTKDPPPSLILKLGLVAPDCCDRARICVSILVNYDREYDAAANMPAQELGGIVEW
jgi:hypothetical protein